MPFTQTPATSTNSTKEIELALAFDNRTGGVTKDIDILNCFFEKNNDKETYCYSRAGIADYINLPSSSVRGIYYWEDLSRILVATSNDVTIYNSDTGATIATLLNIFTTFSGDVGFSEFLYDTNTTKIVITDGTTLGTVDSANVWTASADVDLPTPHLPQPIFLDGYLFLVKSGTADIYNSDLNDPLAYTAGNFLSCEMFPDTVLKFAKLNNYLVAFGSASIEYFWDAANETGSPLQRNDTPVKLLGYLGGFAQNGNKIYFVGNTATSTPEIFVLEDFKVEPIGVETVRRYLESLTLSQSLNIGNVVSFMGHDFYVMAVGTLTYVYDIKNKQWGRWAYKQNDKFDLVYGISAKSNTTYTSVIYINGESTLMKFNSSIYQDNGISFTFRLITPKQNFNTYNRKFASRLVIYADRPDSSTEIGISWTDDDYQTYSTARTVELNQALPSLQRGGVFRRRAYKIEYTGTSPIRIRKMELDINMGQT